MTVPTLVMPSLALVPVSLAKPSVGADGAPTSTVIAAALLPTAPMLPAASVCLTCTPPMAWFPAGRTKLLPLPAVKMPPPLVLYCHEAPGSMPATIMVPALVMPSPAFAPLSLTSTRVGAGGAPVSTPSA